MRCAGRFARSFRATGLAAAALILAAAGACNRSTAGGEEPVDPMLLELRRFEAGLRASAPPFDGPGALGADPYVVANAGDAVVGLRRGDAKLVLLDPELREIASADAGPLADALAVAPDGTVLVGGEASSIVRRFAIDATARPPRFVPHEALDLDPGLPKRPGGARSPASLRALAVHRSGTVYAVDETHDLLLYRRPADAGATAMPLPRGPFRVVATDHYLVAASLIGHALTVIALAPDGAPAGTRMGVVHDGPFWGIAAREEDGVLEIAAGGVEDHALDRTIGSFGYVDSFLFTFRVAGDRLEPRASIDLGASGVVTPKALAFLEDGELFVAGYGADRAAIVRGGFDDGDPTIEPMPISAGVASVVETRAGVIVGADPLLDAWISLPPAGSSAPHAPLRKEHVVLADSKELPARSPRSRLGEALVFTTLMSPWTKTDGPLSRFTCETCHFEGFVDGRTHRTGRGDVVATTKPLHGLFVNEPHFTRALDLDMATMIMSEFRVAASNTDHDPVFSLPDVTGSPALPGGVDFVTSALPDDSAGTPLELRESLMEFLRDLGPRPNVATLGRDRMNDLERDGAAVFARTCAGCHAPRLAANDPASEIPFEEWEREIFTGDRIVWARDGREKTGIEPYVHPEGARPTSLRRLARKRPYFTNGSSPNLSDVLARVRLTSEGFFHAAPAGLDGRALSGDEKEALEAFLALL